MLIHIQLTSFVPLSSIFSTNILFIFIFKFFFIHKNYFQVGTTGKRRSVAALNVNMKKYATLESSQQQLKLDLKPTTKKIVSARLECTISCVFLREGKAT